MGVRHVSRRAIRRQVDLKSSEKDNNRASKDNEEYSRDNNCDSSIVADLAKGFAQANMVNVSADNEAILGLLQKVNSQLEKLQSGQGNQSESGQQQQSQQQPQQQSRQAQSGNNTKLENEEQAKQELQNLFSKVLLNSSDSSQNSQTSSNEANSKAKSQTNLDSSMAIKTASQVLAKAQYELANELESSLQKLKQVISESEKIANQVSDLLGEGSNKKM
ncbi:hypothetical protein SDC9_05855 [bioreactor metagenome]|uniref:Uncharacterized protein n=1 Tax=bioreactor metagenome TaxID=1076179 RepID=A0A644T1E6_9ZZZZ